MAVALLAGCNVGVFDAREQHQLEEAQRLWNASRPQNYSIEIRLSCFCGNALADFTRLDIHGDTVVAAHALTGGPDPSPRGWPTVDNVFGYLHDLAGQHYDHLTDVWARYDPTWGFPAETHVRCDDSVADCGASFFLRNLRPLP